MDSDMTPDEHIASDRAQWAAEQGAKWRRQVRGLVALWDAEEIAHANGMPAAGIGATADELQRVVLKGPEPFRRLLDRRPACGRVLVGRGDDTTDPLCALDAGHEGSCAT